MVNDGNLEITEEAHSSGIKEEEGGIKATATIAMLLKEALTLNEQATLVSHLRSRIASSTLH